MDNTKPKTSVHKIFWLKLMQTCGGNDWGWKTACGEYLWPWWRGTTERNGVTCKKCLKYLSRVSDRSLDREVKYGKKRWQMYLEDEGYL
jgi:hypothetical protein